MSFSSFRGIKNIRPYENILRDPCEYILGYCNLDLYSLSDFIIFYKNEIENYFEIDVCDFIPDEGKHEVICAVDISNEKKSTMTRDLKKRTRKAGKKRRDKIKNKYSYENPFNRIHGYVILENNPGEPRREGTLCINIICTSFFSDKKAIGSWLMESVIHLAKSAKYNNIVLEVGNQEAITRKDDMEESEEESEEESAEESTGESAGESAEESEEENHEDLIDVVTNSLWRKSVRQANEYKEPIYIILEEYIRDVISDYIYDEISENVECEYEKDPDEDIYSYGGYFYKKGKRESSKLIKFYERYGFKEEEKVNTAWKCFTSVPLPAMIRYL